MSIKTNHLFYTYSLKGKEKVFVVNDINIEIKNNSFTAIIGKTGSGKSTLIQNFNGLLLPYDGTVEVEDFILTSKKKKNKNIKLLRKHLGVVFQFPEYQLFEETVLKDVAFGPKNFGLSEEEATLKAKESLSLVGINESYYQRSPFELSGGERRKIALAGILAIDPDILVFDEPTAGLDNKSVDELLLLLTKLHNNGKTLVLVTHDMDIVYQYADHAIVLENGKVVFDGTPKELFNQNEEGYSLHSPDLVTLNMMIKKYDNNAPKEDFSSLEEAIIYLKNRSKHAS